MICHHREALQWESATIQLGGEDKHMSPTHVDPGKDIETDEQIKGEHTARDKGASANMTEYIKD